MGTKIDVRIKHFGFDN